MKIGGELLDILEMFKRNQQQIDLLTANNMQLASYLQQAGIIQNYGGLPALLQPPTGLEIKRPRGRPPMKSLMGMGVPVEHVEALGRPEQSQTIDGAHIGPSRVVNTRISVTPGGNNRYVKVYENDPEGKYFHRQDGSIMVLKDGQLKRRKQAQESKQRSSGWSPERRAAFSKAQKERMANLSKKQKQELTFKRLKTIREKRLSAALT